MTTRKYEITDPGNVTWADIKGQDEAVKAMREAIELPYSNAATYAAYGHKPARGVLLYGPTGCGKTMLAKAAANSSLSAAVVKKPKKKRSDEQKKAEVVVRYGDFMPYMNVNVPEPKDDGLREGRAAFLYVKGGELNATFIGQSEQWIRDLFRQARDAAKKTKRRTILFIDEAESMLGHRGAHKNRTAVMSACTVPAFLTELDGMATTEDVFVILATNMPESIDDAIQRDGRIDRKIEVQRPGRSVCVEIAAAALAGKPLSGADPEELCNQLFSTVVTSMTGEVNGETCTVAVTLGDLVCGSLVVGIVSKATQLAVNRDIEGGLREPSGVSDSDISAAIAMAAKEQMSRDLSNVIYQKAGAEVAKVLTKKAPVHAMGLN